MTVSDERRRILIEAAVEISTCLVFFLGGLTAIVVAILTSGSLAQALVVSGIGWMVIGVLCCTIASGKWKEYKDASKVHHYMYDDNYTRVITPRGDYLLYDPNATTVQADVPEKANTKMDKKEEQC